MNNPKFVLPVEIWGQVFFWLARGRLGNTSEQLDSLSVADILYLVERQDMVLKAGEVCRLWRKEALHAVFLVLRANNGWASRHIASYLIHAHICKLQTNYCNFNFVEELIKV
jgi:hypothetical protein